MSRFLAGLIGIVVIVAFCYGAYTKFADPFSSSFTAHVIFWNANGLQPDSLVRIAGVNVGKVTSVSPVTGCRKTGGASVNPQCTASDVTMQISGNGLPLHKDATFWIRPRIFLEGNFYIEATQGTPEAPIAPNGFVFPIQSGRGAVQLDQVLTSLQSNTRKNLQTLLQQYGFAVKTGGPAYDQSIQYWTPAYKYGSEVSHEALGTQTHDLSNWINKAGVVNGALDANPPSLKSLVTDLNTTAGAFAREGSALQRAIAELPLTLQVAIPAAERAEPSVPAAAGVRLSARAGGRVDRAPRQREPALLPSASPVGLATGTPRPGPRPVIDGARAGQAQQGDGAVHAQRGPAGLELSGQRDPPLEPPHDPRPALQRVEWLPAAPGLRRGRRLPAGARGRVSQLRRQRPVHPRAGHRRHVHVLAPAGPVRAVARRRSTGVEPQLPAPHNSGDGASVKVTRPPLKENVPCETQPAITEAGLQASTGSGAQAGPHQRRAIGQRSTGSWCRRR